MANSSTRDFDGSTSVLTSSSAYSFTTGDFTVGAWINPDALSGKMDIMASGNGSTTGWGFRTNSTGLQLTKWAVVDIASSGITLTINTWQYVAVSVDNGTDATFYHLTEDGTLTTSNVASATNANASATALTIGGSAVTKFNGQVAHSSVWSRLLSQNEVLESARNPGRVANSLTHHSPIYGAASPELDLSTSQTTLTMSGSQTAALDSPKNIITKG